MKQRANSSIIGKQFVRKLKPSLIRDQPNTKIATEKYYELCYIECPGTEINRKGNRSQNVGEYDSFYGGLVKNQRAQKIVSILVHKDLKKYRAQGGRLNQRIIKF